VRALRILDTKHLAVSILPTHLCVGLSYHTVVVPTPVRDSAGKKIPSRLIRFLHLHFPLFYVTISWKALIRS